MEVKPHIEEVARRRIGDLHAMLARDLRYDGEVPTSGYWQQRRQSARSLLGASTETLTEWQQQLLAVDGPNRDDYRLDRDKYCDDLLARYGWLLGRIEPARAARVAIRPDTIGFVVGNGRQTEETLLASELMLVSDALGVWPDAGRPCTIAEIGPTYGTLAEQIRHWLPNARIVVADYPEFLILSGFYLGREFPDARIRVAMGDDSDLSSDWTILLVPFDRLVSLASLPIDLGVVRNGFLHMPGALVAEIASVLHAARCPAIVGAGEASPRFAAGLGQAQSEALQDRYFVLRRLPVFGAKRMPEWPSPNGYFAAFRRGADLTAEELA